jgi:hypothetical protein
MASRAIIVATMVGAMANHFERKEDNDLVLKAKTQAEALGRMNLILTGQICDRFVAFGRLKSNLCLNLGSVIASSVFLESVS